MTIDVVWPVLGGRRCSLFHEAFFTEQKSFFGKLLVVQRFEPGTAGWETEMLPLCYAVLRLGTYGSFVQTKLIVFHYELWNFSGGLVFTKRIKRWPGCLRLPVVSLHLAGHPPVRPHRRLGHSHLSRVGRAGKKNMQQPSFVVLNPILAERAKSQK